MQTKSNPLEKWFDGSELASSVVHVRTRWPSTGRRAPLEWKRRRFVLMKTDGINAACVAWWTSCVSSDATNVTELKRRTGRWRRQRSAYSERSHFSPPYAHQLSKNIFICLASFFMESS